MPPYPYPTEPHAVGTSVHPLFVPELQLQFASADSFTAKSRNTSSACHALPEVIASRASLTPSLRFSARPATTSNAAAFMSTMSKTGVSCAGILSPDVSRVLNATAFSAGDEPLTSSSGCVGSPKSAGRSVRSRTFPSSSSSHKYVSPAHEISSKYSAPHTTYARFTPPALRAATKGGPRAGSATPRTMPRGRVGLRSGPRTLNTVRKGNARLAGAKVASDG
ncbi:hypothetical protein F5888DRAFT_1337878 [Russula emetica]|nr:hypothetical protein F5888DRAFT_1337878 [Russula emetica]